MELEAGQLTDKATELTQKMNEDFTRRTSYPTRDVSLLTIEMDVLKVKAAAGDRILAARILLTGSAMFACRTSNTKQCSPAIVPSVGRVNVLSGHSVWITFDEKDNLCTIPRSSRRAQLDFFFRNPIENCRRDSGMRLTCMISYSLAGRHTFRRSRLDSGVLR